MALITLLRPPTVTSKHSYSIPVTPPLGLAYIAGALRAAGHSVQFIDALAEGLSNVAPAAHANLVYQGLATDDLIARIDPKTQAVGVSSMFSVEWPHLHDIIERIGGRFPGLPIILGGEHPTATYDYILRTCPAVTCVGLGEGEETIREFAEFLDGERELSSVASLAYRGRDGAVIRTKTRERVRAIDGLARPAWDMVPLEVYLDGGYGHGVDLGRSIPILASRGCPYQCTFCSSPAMWTTRYYARKPALVVDEIEEYLKKYGATNIDFYDLTAIVRKDWILEFCREIDARRLSFTWQLPTGTRSEALDAEVLAALYRSGCRNLTYAPESGSAETLMKIKKRITLSRMVDSIREAKRQGITVKCNLIIGFPEETRRDIWRSVLFIWKTALYGVSDSSLFTFSPYPGSELFDSLRAKGRIAEMNDDYFASLCYTDFSVVRRYCDRVGAAELNFYRIFGMSVFYLLSYLSHPGCILRLLGNFARGRSETIFEQRLLEMAKRRGGVMEKRPA